jgi:hypothetical protein
MGRAPGSTYLPWVAALAAHLQRELKIMLVLKLVSSSGVELTQRYKHENEAITNCQRFHCLIADRPVVIDGRRFVLR